MTDVPRTPGIWIPYAVLGALLSMSLFLIAFVGSVRVAENNLNNLNSKIDRLEQELREADVDRRDFAVRIGRLEMAGHDGPKDRDTLRELNRRWPP